MSTRFRKAVRVAETFAHGHELFPRQRIYLCNWFVKLVKPGKEIPNDQVQCHIPMKMTKFDVRNYFEKIYGLKIASVHTRIQKGKLQRDKKQPNKFLKKKGDTKVAYLTLADQTFKFPDLFGRYKPWREDMTKELDDF